MLKAPDTVSIEFVRGMLSGMVASPDATHAWLTDAGIAPALLDLPAARVTPEQYVALFTLLMERLDDEFLGLLGRPPAARQPGVDDALDAGQRDPGAGAAAPDRHLAAAPGGHRVHAGQVTARSPDCGWCGSHPALPDRTFLHELLLRVFWRLIVWLHGGRLRPARFDFAFAAPVHAAEYATVFPGAVRFDQAHTTVWFEAATLALPMLRDAAALRTFLAQAPGIVIVPRRDGHTTGARVRAHLQSTRRPTWPDLAATAAALHLSTSTLQRHLADRGAELPVGQGPVAPRPRDRPAACERGAADHARARTRLRRRSGVPACLQAVDRPPARRLPARRAAGAPDARSGDPQLRRPGRPSDRSRPRSSKPCRPKHRQHAIERRRRRTPPAARRWSADR